MPASPKVTTIIPTMATRERAAGLRRAIDSVRRASDHPAAIIVVVNGERADAQVCDWLKAQRDVHFHYVAQPSAPNAVLQGRRLVSTPYFSALDDDDEYLAGGLDVRLKALESSPDADLVITNGYRHVEGNDDRFYETLDGVDRDPLANLFTRNWLASCNNLFRSTTVGVEFFEDYHPYIEWTWLAYRLGLAQKKVKVVDRATFRNHDTPLSLSKSKAYGETLLALYGRMLSAGPEPAVRQLIRKRIGAAWHGDSVRALRRGERLRALACHLRSMCLPGAARYLAYSRYLVPGWPKSQ